MSKSFAFMRWEKLHSMKKISLQSRHDNREQNTPNANPNRFHLNRRIIGGTSEEICAQVRSMVEQVRQSGGRVTKQSVLAISGLCTFSPEVWASIDEAKRDAWLKRWVNANRRWLANTFGGLQNIVELTLHMDETTPHLHWMVVPIVRENVNGQIRLRLSAKHYLGGHRDRAVELQDIYAKAMESLGLKRGIRRSKAKHTEIRKWYGMMKDGRVVSTRDVLLSPKAAAERIRALQALVNGDARYQLIAIEKTKEAEALQKQVDNLQQENRRLEQEIEYLTESRKRAREREEALRKELEQAKNELYMHKRRIREEVLRQLRGIPTTSILQRYGFEPHPYDKHKWVREVAGNREVISTDGVKWKSWTSDAGGGGAIDLVMHLEQCDFLSAVSILQQQGYSPAEIGISVTEAIERKEAPEPQPPKVAKDQRAFDAVWRWLMSRGFPEKFAYNLLKAGIVIPTRRGRYINAWFPSENGGGEIYGITGHWRGSPAGYEKIPIVYTVPSPKRIIITESAIDALSAKLLFKDAITLSTSGSACLRHLPETVSQLRQKFGDLPVLIATDWDKAGDRMAEIIQAVVPSSTRMLPVEVGLGLRKEEKDLNDVIQRMAAESIQRDAGR
jgi:5S rRNA maturation endonuclease (ribonuclease M5)